MSDDEPILKANRAFYRHFTQANLTEMAALWSRSAEVVCIHPGAAPLHGYAAVMDSWKQILESPPEVRCIDAVVCCFDDFALVTCREILPGGQLIATNGFRREQDGFRMVHHQAGPAPARVQRRRDRLDLN